MPPRSGTSGTPRARAREKPKWEAKFLEAFRKTGIVAEACRVAQVGRTTAYRHREKDERFAEEWRMANEDAADVLEAEAWRRAVDGVPDPVYQGGKLVGAVRRYDSRLLEMLLRARRPEKFRDNHKHEIGGADGKAIHFVLTPETGGVSRDEPQS